VLGLALRTTTTCPMELNLRPAYVVRRHELEKRRPFFILAASCLILALLGWSFYYTQAAHGTQRATERLQEKIDTMRAAEARLDKVKKQVASLDSFSTPLIDAINDRSFWVEIVEDLNARLPKEDIWITELIPTSGGKALGAPDARTVSALATPTPAAAQPQRPGAIPGRRATDALLVRGLHRVNSKQLEVLVH